MPLANNVFSFAHIKDQLDLIVQNGRCATMQFMSPEKAKRWRYQVYHLRRLIQKQTGAGTPYDSLQLIIKKDSPTVVHIGNAAVEGELVFGDEPLRKAPDPAALELQEFAREKGLDLEEMNENLKKAQEEYERKKAE